MPIRASKLLPLLVLALLLPAPALLAQPAPDWGFNGEEAPRLPTGDADFLSDAFWAPARGPQNAPVTLVVFSDFQCPFCAKVVPTLEQIQANYAQQVRIVFHHYPLPFHKDAEPAARAAFAAQMQGAFWPYHDLLFANQKALSDEELTAYAQQIGLDLTAFELDRKSQEARDQVARDAVWVKQLGVRGTPGFFINGRRLSGAQPLKNFAAIIDDELDKSSKLTPEQVQTAGSATAARTRINVAWGLHLDTKAADARKQQRRHPVSLDGLAVKGDADALLTTVAFFRHDDPGAADFAERLALLQSIYGKELRVALLPWPQILSPRSERIGALLLAANARGADTVQTLHACLLILKAEDELPAHLTACGLDANALLDEAEGLESQLSELRTRGQSYGLTAEPALFINGYRIEASEPLEVFLQAAQKELGRAELAVSLGTKRSDLYAHISTPPPAAQKDQAPANDVRVYIPVADRPVLGKKDAPVTIVEVSDFECPYCRKVQPTLQAIQERYGDDVRMVFVNRPLSFHKQAHPAARASWAAHQQGKFWEFHHLLFAQTKLTDDTYPELASQLGLDLSRFQSDMTSAQATTAVDGDDAAAQKAGASGTPTFFINGRKLSGAQPLDRFTPIIDEELERARELVDSGEVKASKVYQHIASSDGVSLEVKKKKAKKRSKSEIIAELPEWNTRKHVEMLPQRPVIGPSDAKVTIVAFSEFQCPFCSRVLPTLSEIQKTYGDDVRLVFANLPLDFHPEAEPAARAAWAAHQQGRFWDYHDLLFAQQKQLGAETYVELASQLGLDLARFESDMSDPEAAAHIQEDIQLAGQLGLSGTPSFLVNGRKFVGAQPLDAFKRLIDEEIQYVDAIVDAKIVKPAGIYNLLTAQSLASSNLGRLSAKRLLSRGSSKSAHQVVLFLDLAQGSKLTRSTLEALQAAAAQHSEDHLHIVIAPIATSDNDLPARALAATGDVEDALALGLALSGEPLRDMTAIEVAAATAGLDGDALTQAMKKTDKTLKASQKAAKKLGVLGAPTLLIDGQLMRGPISPDDLAARLR